MAEKTPPAAPPPEKPSPQKAPYRADAKRAAVVTRRGGSRPATDTR